MFRKVSFESFYEMPLYIHIGLNAWNTILKSKILVYWLTDNPIQQVHVHSILIEGGPCKSWALQANPCIKVARVLCMNWWGLKVSPNPLARIMNQLWEWKFKKSIIERIINIHFVEKSKNK